MFGILVVCWIFFVCGCDVVIIRCVMLFDILLRICVLKLRVCFLILDCLMLMFSGMRLERISIRFLSILVLSFDMIFLMFGIRERFILLFIDFCLSFVCLGRCCG